MTASGAEYAGKISTLGLVSERCEANYVQLPIETTQWNDTFTVEDYKALVAQLLTARSPYRVILAQRRK